MKLPSLQALIGNAIVVLKRFPFVLLISALGTAAMIAANEWGGSHHWLANFIMTSVLGLSLLLCVKLFAERKGFNKKKLLSANLLGILVIASYYFSLPEQVEDADIIRYCMLLTFIHLSVSVAPYLAAAGQTNGFWQYNKTIFLRILLSGLYTGVLYGGIAIALVAVDNLFNIHIRSEIYLDFYFFLAGIFNTWFFLAGIPEDFHALDENHSYPSGLKIFTQYVLLPLVVLYLLILYAYTGKIIVEWNLPRGWVAYLVIAFSIAGILSLLLIYPVREKEGNTWMKVFSKFFYLAILPLIVLLFASIFERVNEYGITEPRYIVVAIALWLAGISLYFIFSKLKNIKVVPVSLAIISIAASFGPWGAFDVSERSQMGRLKELLMKNNLLKEDKALKGNNKLGYKDGQDIHSIIKYLYDRDKTGLETLFALSIPDTISEWQLPDFLGMKYIPNVNDERNITIRAKEVEVTNINGYDFMISDWFNTYDKTPDSNSFQLNKDSLIFIYKDQSNTIDILVNNKKQDSILLKNTLTGFVKRTASNNEYYINDVSGDSLSFTVNTKKYQIKFFVNEVDVYYSPDSMTINRLGYKALFKTVNQK